MRILQDRSARFFCKRTGLGDLILKLPISLLLLFALLPNMGFAAESRGGEKLTDSVYSRPITLSLNGLSQEPISPQAQIRARICPDETFQRLRVHMAIERLLAPASPFNRVSSKASPTSSKWGPSQEPNSCIKISPTRWIIPSILFTSGFLLIEQFQLSGANRQDRENWKRDHRFTEWRYIDDALQYAPLLIDLSLHMSGLKGRSASESVFWLSTSLAAGMMGTAVCGIKAIGLSQRPDGSSWNSFPSGHTATAFLGAELLRIEYGEELPWLAAQGYLLAIATGALRIFHDRHWTGDVLAGAGIGIASAWFGYLVQQEISDRMEQKRVRRMLLKSAMHR